MGNFKRVIISIIALLVILSSTMLTSCMYMQLGGSNKDEYISKSELEDILNNRLSGNVTVNGGDNYDITIEGGEKLNLVLASKALLSAVSIYCTFKTVSYSRM